jgi:streptomycin 6-kinase
MIQQSLQDAERAIHAHPPDTVGLYESALRAFVEGQDTLTEHPALSAKGLTVDEYKLLQRYLLAMAFVSAWYHRHSDKAQRDKAAHSAAQLRAALLARSVCR